MPIEDFYARSESDVVTFSRTQIHFSASLVEKNNLADYEFARIGIDPELRRIYFAFQRDAAPGLLKFYRQSGRSKRKMISARALYAQLDWLSRIQDEKEFAKKQFILEKVDEMNAEIYPKYKFFITVGYAWASDRIFTDDKDYPEEPGVYRLKKDGEVVRIGEGNNIANRLKEHRKAFAAAEIDMYDFEIVPNEIERKNEQKRLIESFRATVGRLPKLNPIAN